MEVAPDIERLCQLFHKPGCNDRLKELAGALQKSVLNPQLIRMLKKLQDKKPTLFKALQTIDEKSCPKKNLPESPLSASGYLAVSRKAYRPFEQALQNICTEAKMDARTCLHMGDIKHIRGVLCKLKLKKTLHDMLRATCTFSTNVQLSVLVEAVYKHFDVVALDNKFKSRKETEPPCLHLKLRFKELPPQLQGVVGREAWVMELQLTTPEILNYKATHCHPVYELWRDGPFPRVCPVCGMCPNLVASKEVKNKSTVADGVEKGKWRGNDIAMKTLAYNETEVEDCRAEFVKEVNCHAKLDHPNIVPLIGVIDEENRLAILTEWAHEGTLEQNLAKDQLNFTEKVQFALEICDALIYLHRNALVHSDLKSANIFFRKYCGRLWVMLGDFGLAQKLKSISKGSAYRGTPNYMSPEAFGELAEGDKSATDVWALACVLIEMFAEGKHQVPWNGQTEAAIQGHVLAGRLPPELDRVKHTAINALVRKCLSSEPKHRPTVEQVRAELEKLVKRCVNFFLLDISGSMNWRSTWNPKSIRRKELATLTILNCVEHLLREPHQEMCLLTFNDTIEECIPRTNVTQHSKKQFDSELRELSSRSLSGDTNLYGALEHVLQRCKRLPRDFVTRIYLLTDGRDNSKRSESQTKLKQQFKQLFGSAKGFKENLLDVRTYSLGTLEETKELDQKLARAGLSPAIQLVEMTSPRMIEDLSFDQKEEEKHPREKAEREQEKVWTRAQEKLRLELRANSEELIRLRRRAATDLLLAERISSQAKEVSGL